MVYYGYRSYFNYNNITKGVVLMLKKLFSITVILSILCMFFCFNMGFTANADTKYKEGYYTYTVTDGKATIIACDKAISGDVTIPEKLGGYPVVKIGNKAFSWCHSLKSIIVPDNVTEMYTYAFAYCSELTSVSISDNVRYLDVNTFSYCEKLTDVKLPANLKKIFMSSFSYCKNLKKIDIPDTVTFIDMTAFFGCKSLENIKLPRDLKRIGEYAFYKCSKLKEITIPENVTKIESGAFGGCESLVNISVDPNNEMYKNDGNSIIDINNKKIILAGADYVIPNDGSIETIDEFAFVGKIKKIIIPNSVTKIHRNAFSDLTSLETVEISLEVLADKQLGYYFNECMIGYVSGFGEIITDWENYIYATEENDGDYYEYYDPDERYKESNGFLPKSLKNIIITGGGKKINKKTFYGISGLKSVTIPKNITKIGDDAFNGCKGLKDVYYSGSKADWAKISIANGNEYLTKATIHYAIETPTQNTNSAVSKPDNTLGKNETKKPEDVNNQDTQSNTDSTSSENDTTNTIGATEEKENQNTDNKEKDSSLWIWIIVSVLAVLIIGAAIIFLLYKKGIIFSKK